VVCVASKPADGVAVARQTHEFAAFAQPPPFTLEEVRRAIPAHCWEKNAARSVGYLIRDVLSVAALAAIAATVNDPAMWAAYALLQGTLFWGLFVVGHDAGHGSFSNNKLLNEVMGHLAHASILVPFHGWRISHRDHHANHGHVENDESWYPYAKSDYDSMKLSHRLFRFELPFALFGYPIYLFKRTPMKTGSHFLPSSPLFRPSEARSVLTSTGSLIAMLGVLGAITAKIGLAAIAKLYVAPLVVFWVWLAVVTYLHHTDPSCPFYRDGDWSYLRGGLSTTDRDYGVVLNELTHSIGTHVVHHLFPQIPHYHLEEANAAIRPVLGKYYREPQRSGLLPLHLVSDLFRSFRECRFVKDQGSVVFYEK